MKHPYFEGVFSFPHGEPGLRHAFVRQLLPTCTASPSQAAIRRCWCRPPVCVLCNQRLIDSPCALFFCKWSGLIPAASSSVWTIISQAVLPSCSSSDPPPHTGFFYSHSSFFRSFFLLIFCADSHNFIWFNLLFLPPSRPLLSFFPPNQWAYWLRISVRYPGWW